MEEKNILKFKKEEFAIREYIKEKLGKGKISKVRIEYTPVGENIIITTHKMGLIIGRGGEKIIELTRILKRKFKLENPHIEIEEVKKPDLDAQIVADNITLALERFGPLRFKVTAYRTLQRIMDSGALGAEIRLSGKLPSARSRTWKFSQGYLKKTGESAEVVDRALSIAQTKPGTVGVKVSILRPDVVLKDRININEDFINKMKENIQEIEEENKTEKIKKTKK